MSRCVEKGLSKFESQKKANSGSPYMRRNPYMRRTPIQPNYGSNSHRIFGDAFFFRVLPFENFFGSCDENGGHDWAFTQKSMQFLALCQGCSGSILLWKSISSQQVAIFMPKTHLAYQSWQSAAAFLPNVCQQNQWENVLGGPADA